jgi:hypothetical protein
MNWPQIGLMTETSHQNVLQSEEALRVRPQHVVIGGDLDARNKMPGSAEMLRQKSRKMPGRSDVGVGAQAPTHDRNGGAAIAADQHLWVLSIVRSYDSSLFPSALVMTSLQR